MVEHGAPLSKQLAFQLVRKISGLTLDWLFYGRIDGLSIELAHRLDVLPRTAHRDGVTYSNDDEARAKPQRGS
jgi:hypothetical protein